MEKEMIGKPSIDKPWLKYYDIKEEDFKMPQKKLFNYIKENNEQNLNAVALNFMGKKIKYDELFANVERTAKALKRQYVQEGDVVTICNITTPETIYLLLALNKIGAVANMIDPRINADNIKNSINNTNSKIMFMLDIAYPKIKKIALSTGLEEIVTISISDSLPFGLNYAYDAKQLVEKMKTKQESIPKNDIYVKWNSFVENGKKYEGSTEVEYQPNRPTAIMYTGGTTGTPKGAVLTDDNAKAMIFQFQNGKTRWERNDKFLEIMPAFLAYGYICGVAIPLYVGMNLIIIPKFEASKFDQYIVKHQPNHIMGVPSYFEDLTNSPLLKNKDLSFLKSAIVGGDRLDPKSEEEINEFFQSHGYERPILKGYGMTEMSSNSVYTVDENSNPIGGIGIPLLTNNFKVINPETKEELSYNEEGEICLTGPTMFAGYINNPEENKKIFNVHEDGKTWIHTGDVGKMDEEGRVFITGRTKEMIIRPDGHNVWPSKIATIISKHPAVKHCAVAGVPSRTTKNGSIPTAFIVLNEEYVLSDINELINEIVTLSLEYLPERDIALEYEFVNEIPLTSVGKVDFMKLKDIYLEKHPLDQKILKK